MNWHAEHHMYAGVPGYNLKKMYEIISKDMPEPKTLIGAWVEMRDTLKKQGQDPNYQYHQKIPTERSLGENNTGNIEKYTESIGSLAPEEKVNQDAFDQVLKSKFDCIYQTWNNNYLEDAFVWADPDSVNILLSSESGEHIKYPIRSKNQI